MGRHPIAPEFGAPGDGLALPEPAAAIDRQLAELAALADPMLPLTPVDTAEAWERFQADGHERAPELHLRPLTVDPDVLKRMLHALPIEAVDDPALGRLFHDKRHE